MSKLIGKLITGAIIACCWIGVGCGAREVIIQPTDGCQPEATRCRGTVAEVCGTDQRWVVVADCAALDVQDAQDAAPGAASGFVCCETTEGHTCLLEC